MHRWEIAHHGAGAICQQVRAATVGQQRVGQALRRPVPRGSRPRRVSRLDRRVIIRRDTPWRQIVFDVPSRLGRKALPQRRIAQRQQRPGQRRVGEVRRKFEDGVIRQFRSGTMRVDHRGQARSHAIQHGP